MLCVDEVLFWQHKNDGILPLVPILENRRTCFDELSLCPHGAKRDDEMSYIFLSFSQFPVARSCVLGAWGSLYGTVVPCYDDTRVLN